MENKIYFPGSYKKALINKTKNTTIRIDKEIGKYKENIIYHCYSYNGTNLNIDIRIKNIYKINLNELSKFGIPDRSIKSLSNKINNSNKVELIKFDYIM